MEKQLEPIKGKRLNLVESTLEVFNKCSDLYLQEDKHWGCDLDIIRSEIDRFSHPKILDAGCGHAWHLANINNLCPHASDLIGLDYSQEMLNMAKGLIGMNKLDNVIEIIKGNILEMPFKEKYFDVVLCLCNTLGNLPGKVLEESILMREKAIRELKRILKPSGVLIISVYNAEYVEKENNYGNVFFIDRELSRYETNDFVVRFNNNGRYYPNSGIPYYSHWFLENEIKQLLEEFNLKITIYEKRLKRIVIVVKKRIDILNKTSE